MPAFHDEALEAADPAISDVRKAMMAKAHMTSNVIHPGRNERIQDSISKDGQFDLALRTLKDVGRK
jgi:hypothetical protein